MIDFLKDYDVYKPRLSQMIVCRLLMTLMTRDFPSWTSLGDCLCKNLNIYVNLDRFSFYQVSTSRGQISAVGSTYLPWALCIRTPLHLYKLCENTFVHTQMSNKKCTHIAPFRCTSLIMQAIPFLPCSPIPCHYPCC